MTFFLLSLPPPPCTMECGAAEATGPGFVCVVFLLCVLLANRIDCGIFLLLLISHLPPQKCVNTDYTFDCECFDGFEKDLVNFPAGNVCVNIDECVGGGGSEDY